MKLSILTSLYSKYELLAYLNDYHYYFKVAQTSEDYYFDYITLEKRVILLQKFCTIEKKYSTIEDSTFLEEAKENLKNGNYLIIGVDLFDWIEGSLCFERYHWTHYTLVTEYCEDSNTFVVFDDKNSKFVEYSVRQDKMLNAMHHCDLQPKAYIIRLMDEIEFPDITSHALAENAYEIIRSIRTGLDRTYWKLSSTDYKDKWFMDLNALFMKEVECRQVSNKYLMDNVSNFLPQNQIHSLEDIGNKFFDLSKRWGKIRMMLYRLYVSGNYEEILEKINSRIKCCLEDEIQLWYDFVKQIINIEFRIKLEYKEKMKK